MHSNGFPNYNLPLLDGVTLFALTRFPSVQGQCDFEGTTVTETFWARKENWVGSQIEDSFVMLNYEDGEYVSLNSTATDIWNALASPRSARDIVADLTARYEISPSDCEISVNRVLEELATKGLVQQNS